MYVNVPIFLRYGQIVILLLTKTKDYDVNTLHRDSALLRFLHGFLTSGPIAAVQLYTVIKVLTMPTSTTIDFRVSPYPIILSSLVSTGLSLLLTLISYTASDRLHSDTRRVVIPGYLTLFLWHICLIPARITSIALFSVAYGPFITVVIGIHWLAAGIWTFAERTNFCGDLSRTPPKKRYYFEVPFIIIVSFIFTFLFFNIREGSSLGQIIVYHILTSIETVLLCSLFYAAYPNLDYAPWVFAVTVGMYILGVAFMFLYYTAWHPSRTEDCFIIGCPKRENCCSCFNKSEPHIGNVDLPLHEIQDSTNIVSNTNSNNSQAVNVVPLSVSQHTTFNNGTETLTGQPPIAQRYSGTILTPYKRYSSGSQYRFDTLDHIQGGSGSFSRSNSERFRHRSHSHNMGQSLHDVQTRPLSRQNQWRHSEGHIYSHLVPRQQQYAIENPSIPSPIGEEPGAIASDIRKFSAPPLVQITGATDEPHYSIPRHLSRASKSTPAVLPFSSISLYDTPRPTNNYLEPVYYKRCKRIRSELERQRVNQQSTNQTHNIYSVPRMSRHRSLSPGNERYYSRSANTTPKQSPHAPRKKKRSSNPLHTHDPMMEFTRLYSSNPSINYTKIQRSQTSPIDIANLNRFSTSSSYILSPDNNSDITDPHILRSTENEANNQRTTAENDDSTSNSDALLHSGTLV